MRYILFILVILLSLRVDAVNSPIIYGQVGGVRCAYDLISRACVATGSAGVTTAAAIGASANANGMTISGSNINLEPASASFGGVVTTGGQTMAGDKVFSGKVFVGSTTQDASGARFKVAGGNNDDYIASFHGPSGTSSGFVLVAHTAATGSDIQGVTAVTLAANRPINFNPNGEVVSLGSGAGTVKIPSYADGTLSVASGVIVSSSDERMKKDFRNYERGLEAIDKIQPKCFKWKDPIYGDLEHCAFVAQDVEKGLPEAVTQGPEGMLGLDQATIIAGLVNAVKELKALCPQPITTKKVIAHRARKAQSKKVFKCGKPWSKEYCDNMLKEFNARQVK